MVQRMLFCVLSCAAPISYPFRAPTCVAVLTKLVDLRLRAQWAEHGDPLLVAPGTSVLVAANLFAFSRRVPVRFWNLLPHMVVYNGEVLNPLVLNPFGSLAAPHAFFPPPVCPSCFLPTTRVSLPLPCPIYSTLWLATTGFTIISSSD